LFILDTKNLGSHGSVAQCVCFLNWQSNLPEDDRIWTKRVAAGLCSNKNIRWALYPPTHPLLHEVVID